MSKSWDSSVLKKLKALLGKGLSTAEIGKRLGISKNAVVGKLHRLGWNMTANDASKTKSVKKVVTSGTKKPVKVAQKNSAKVAVKGVKAEAAKAATKSGKVVVAKGKVAVSKNTNVKAQKSVAKKTTVAKTPEKKITLRGAKTTAVHQRIVQHSLEMANLKPNQCRWPIGDPDSENFHFCGRPVFVGKPYCYEHCRQAYQFTAPKKK